MTASPSMPAVTILGLNYSPEHTGIAAYTSSFARSLADGSVAVNVITGYPHYPQWQIHAGYRGLSMREVVAGVPVMRLRHPIPAQPKTINRFVMELVFGLRAASCSWGKPDVALLVTPALFSTAALCVAARLRRIPTVIWVQDIYSLGVTETGATSRGVATIIKRIESAVLRSATTVIVIHDRFKRYLVDELGVDPAKVEVVRNWAHTEFPPIPDPASRAQARRHLGWGENDVVVLHAGNMGVKQGLENVINASRMASQRNSSVKFVLLGDGNQRAHLASLGGNPNLAFISPLPGGEFETAVAAADILLVNELPGMTEMSVPSKLTTYFSSGRPVIAATDEASTTGEEIRISRAGVRVDAADPKALLEAAEALYKNARLATALGQAGRQFALDKLSLNAATTDIRNALAAASKSI